MATISIICAVYNHEQFLEQAIDSVLGQTYKDWELLLWDDGSSDKSIEICRKYAETYPDQIRFFRHYGGSNEGQEKTRNAALQKATGKYISILDSDDFYLPQKLELLVVELEDEGVGLAFGKAQELNQQTGHIQTIEFEGHDLSVYDLAYYNFISAGAVLFRKDLLKQELLFDSRFKAIGEYPLWVEIALVSKIVFVDKAVSVWRNHGKNTGSVYQVHAKKELLDYALFLKSDSRFQEIRWQAWLQEVIAQRIYDYASELYVAHRFAEAKIKYKEFLEVVAGMENRIRLSVGLDKKAKFILSILTLGQWMNKVFARVKLGLNK